MAKRLLQRSEFLKHNKYNGKVNEAIVQNEVNWGDSLIGRLINSIARKSVIAYRSNKIEKLLSSLRKNFDNMVELSEVNISTGDLNSVEIWTLFSELKRLVDEGGELQEIKNAAKNLRDAVDKSNIEDKEEIVSVIDEFIEFLNQFDSIEDDEGEEGSDDEGSTVDPDSKTGVKIYPLLIKNLKSLSLILSQYMKKDGQRGVEVSKTEEFESIFYVTKPNDTIELIQKKPENKFKWDADKIWDKNLKSLASYDEKFKKNPKQHGGNKFKIPLTSGIKIFLGKGKKEKGILKEVLESYIFEEAALKPGQLGVGGSEKRGEIKSSETHLSQAFSKLKKDLDVLVSAKEKGISIDSKFINDIVAKSIDSKTKETIFELYKEIQRYLIGDKKATLQERDKLYTESLETITDKKKQVVVAEKIARFTKRALQFDGEGLYGGMGDIGKPLEDYVNSMKEILKIDLSVKPKEGEKVGESVIKNYNSFVTLIVEKSVSTDEIKEKFDELFTEDIQNKLCLEQEKIDELKGVSKNPGGTYVIRTTDPIVSIIRLFQRAYRLHTPGMIPSGRSEGKVSLSVFNEYEYMGSGSPGDASKPGGGPYRNIKLFDKWQAGVDSILADTKYRPLFSENTIFEFESPTGEKGDQIKAGGKMLLRFVNKLLDDNEMYRGGTDGGALFKVYEEYFGLKLDKNGVFPDRGSRGDANTNNEVAEGVKVTKCDWFNLKDVGITETNLYKLFQTEGSEYDKMCIKFTTKKDGKTKVYYGCIEFIEAKKVSTIIFSEGGYPFDLTKVDLSPKPTSAQKVFYGKIEGDFKSGSGCKIKYVDMENATNATSVKPEEFNETITELKVLADKEEKKLYTGISTNLIGKFSSFNKNRVTAKNILGVR
jgi:hypothetical protein